MCNQPKIIPGVGPVACRICSLCQSNYRKDWVGRCIAEKLTSTKTWVITLTYGGGNHDAAQTLRYEHVQLMLKKLRNHGYKVRYMVAGEYGSGGTERAHWHIVLFFKGASPTFKLNKRYNHPIWEHGFIFVEEPHHANFYYATKYTTKKTNEKFRELDFRFSKFPALGHGYFMELADGYVKEKIAPSDFTYTFRDIKDKKGKQRAFLMRGVTKENFMQRFHEGNMKLDQPLFSEAYDKWLLNSDAAADFEPLTRAEIKQLWKPVHPKKGEQVREFTSLEGNYFLVKHLNRTLHFGKLDKKGNVLWQRDVVGEQEKSLALKCKLGPDAVKERRTLKKLARQIDAAKERFVTKNY